ncbi:MAG TPA: penicillin-binding protein 2 [Kiritimatiellia bacterium]|nr:penicillin-binding protein 2 [Kiritimatiellia bacterium]HOE00914.1 penicillin-binding protein 2 [Kiritimatiellia bacterium]HQF19629.1 penicillin-binding protein 2 [Kiritimatiellia bacterium]HQG73763.1 penicillin-binding protein 2 [Kiritimatiellia bacterium]HQM22777.1 penicillin-binding protein 2 [Kiritimatiellia bacterium]
MPRERERERLLPEVHVWRLLLLWVALLALFGVLVHRLWSLQVAQSSEYQRRLVKQSLRSVRLPGIRGRIYDRNGERLADNQPSYCVSLYLEELRKTGSVQRTVDAVMDTLYRLAETMDRPLQLTPQDVRLHLGRRTPLPLVAWRGLDEVAVARFMEHALEFPGAALTVEPVRVYPQGAVAGHVLGYVGRADDTTLRDYTADHEPETYHYYLPEMAGKSGIEKRLDGLLRANEGGKLEIQVDVTGFKFDEVSTRAPGMGSDITLALDLRIQRAAEQALAGERGAVVVVDPRNGDILALASMPGYNPNDFIPAVPADIWNRLLKDPARPLFNRATGGEYAPGSTFKPVTLLAALESGRIKADTRYSCPGYFDLGSHRFRCWQHWGHGAIDLQAAIRYSCNVYLYHAALDAGADSVQAMARAVGFGRKTDISLDFERAGLVPDAAWKRTARHDNWRDGDTCNLAIGQGALLVTPLQLAMFAAALANGGTLWHPRLMARIVTASGVTNIIPATAVEDGPHWQPQNIRVVRQGMRDAVNQPDGSGKRAMLPNVVVAAKTGTAEYGVKGAGRKMTWMIAFAPYDQPRYALALLVEDGISGGTTAAPRVKQLLTQVFNEVEHMNLPLPAAPLRPAPDPNAPADEEPPAEEPA